MQVKRSKPHRVVALRLVLVLLAIGLLFYAWIPTKKSVVGTYASNAELDPVTIEIIDDGTFTQYSAGQEISGGRWHLESEYYLFKNLELDGSYELPVTDKALHFGRGAMGYPLFHKGGKLCLNIGQEFVYWCKVKSWW